MLPGLRQCLEGVADGRRAGGHRQRRHALFKRRNAPFKDVVGGVGQAAVDVAGVPKAEAVGGVLAVVEHEGGGGVDRHRAGVGGGVGGLLADVELFGFESPVGGIANVRHVHSPFRLMGIFYQKDMLLSNT